MTLTELRFIVTLAEEQHFGRAAARCHVSQPTLSVAIKKLEDELGVALFERTKGRILTTAMGEQVLQKARAALEQTLAIKDLADLGRDQLHSPLRLGTLSNLGPYWLPQAIAYLQVSAPKMPLLLEEETLASLSRKLRAGDLDVILVAQPFSESEIVTQVICTEDFVLLLPHQHPLAAQNTIAVADLNPREILMMGETSDLRRPILEVFPELVACTQYSASLEMLRLMVASGLGIAILPRSAAQTPLYGAHNLVFRPFVAPVPERTLALAWRATFPRHKAIDSLRRALQASSAAYWDFTTARQTEHNLPLVDNSDW